MPDSWRILTPPPRVFRSRNAQTALVILRAAGFVPGKTVFAPAIGGSVGNAVTQLARALGAKHAISSTTSHAKVGVEAEKLGFSEALSTSRRKG